LNYSATDGRQFSTTSKNTLKRIDCERETISKSTFSKGKLLSLRLEQTMKIIKNVWARVLISLLGGGLVQELIHITTGDPNRPMAHNFSLLFGCLIYLGLSFWVNLNSKRPNAN
jgi:hypothetical protein